MTRAVPFVVALLGVALAASSFAAAPEAPTWPSFRGPGGSGLGDGTDPPAQFDADSGLNVRWRAAIPGVGHSSPIVWGDRVFVSTAVSGDPEPDFVTGRTSTMDSAKDTTLHSWRLLCLDLRTGAMLWERIAHEGVPRTRRHLKGSYANPTPATNGSVVVVSFGSEGLYAYDLDGTPVWQQDLGVLDGGWTPVPDTHWGFGSSPQIYGDLVIVQADAQNQAYLAAFDIDDGAQVWRVPRSEDTSWSTPTVYEGASGAELLVSGTHHYRGYDPATGEPLWWLADGVDVKIPMPLVAEGVDIGEGSAQDLLLFGGGSAHEGPRFYALRPGARGEIAVPETPGTVLDHAPPTDGGAIVWSNEARPHVVTPLAYRGYLYVCSDNGILTVYDLGSGQRLHRLRIGGRGGSFSASPVAAEGRIYFAGEDGDVFVLSAGPEPELLATDPVGEVIMATPALAPGVILVRGRDHLFAFGVE